MGFHVLLKTIPKSEFLPANVTLKLLNTKMNEDMSIKMAFLAKLPATFQTHKLSSTSVG